MSSYQDRRAAAYSNLGKAAGSYAKRKADEKKDKDKKKPGEWTIDFGGKKGKKKGHLKKKAKRAGIFRRGSRSA